jgi:tetratricopeptide (TPR) repeat protein
MPPKGKRKPKTKPPTETKESRKIEVKESRGFVIGDFATVINNFWDEKILKRFGLEQRAGFIIIFVAVVVVGVGLFFGLRPKQKAVMTGEFRIAVASFAENGRGLPDKIGYTIADGINIRLSDDLHEITVGPKVEIWSPDRVGVVKGETSEVRAKNAEKLAKQIKAYMVIYGVVEETPSGMSVTPEFYLDTQGFHEGTEIIGQYQLGSSFPLPGANNPAWAYEFDKQMYTRSDIISSLSVGLSYFAVHEYDKALEVLKGIETIQGWEDKQGKEVLYALLGFAAGKAKQYEQTESALQKAIDINPDYARPYIGMANLNYILALKPFEVSKDPSDVDQALLNNCFSYLEKAVRAPEKPPLAEVDTKIHFSRGQCYWLKTYTGKLADYNLAIDEFRQVITAYDNRKDPQEHERVRELAAESHARLGLIYDLKGNLQEAANQYQMAAELLTDIPDRQQLYQERADEIRQKIPQPSS